MPIFLHAATLGVAVCLAVPAWGADPAVGRTAPKSLKDEASWLDMRTSELIGKEVASPDGKMLGEVEDVIVDTTRGAVQHVILSFGGVADAGDKLFIFPANAFRRDENFERLLIEVHPEQLRQSPGYDRANWPFRPPLARASKLRGANVKDAAGRPVGEIEDLVINLGTGRVERVWLAQDGRRGDEDKRAMPLTSFAVSERGEEVVLKRQR
jgi:sporulation protein YlmC with PRC-barrel domain